MSVRPPNIIPYGDNALLVQYETDGFSQELVQAIHALAAELRHNPDWTELVPGYDSLLCVFSLADLSLGDAHNQLEKALSNTKPEPPSAGETIDVPVVYGGEFGPDMDVIKSSSGLSKPEIIKLHSAKPYLVCMTGFIPGFCFLSQAPTALHHDRKATPRAQVPAGSIGIAGWQTGIYGLESPGGWQIIGRTPLTLFDKDRQDPFLIKAGDKVRFVPSKPEIFA